MAGWMLVAACLAAHPPCSLLAWHINPGEQLRRVLVPHTLSLAWRLGKAAAEARRSKADAAAAIAAAGGGCVLFTGERE